MQNYTGNKGGQGIREKLLNLVPVADNHYSLFYGGGGLETCRQLKGIDWTVSEKDKKLFTAASQLHDATYPCYKELLNDNTFSKSDFIYADPPYKFSTRRSGRKYYKHEFKLADHVEFLNYTGSIQAMMLITHPQCKMYDVALKDWYKTPLRYMTRAGWYDDCIYTNYDPTKVELITYECLGFDNTNRQQIKRKRANLLRKVRELPFHERDAFYRELQRSAT